MGRVREEGSGSSSDGHRWVLPVLGVGAVGCLGLVMAVVGSAVIVGLGIIAIRSMDIDLGPGEGKQSQRLPVSVSPAVGLHDGTVVTVTSDSFDAHRVVGIAVCLQEADTESAGVDACDNISGARYAVDASGQLQATFPVPRVITVREQPWDCATPPTQCVIVAADAGDYDKSGGQAIQFAPDLGPTDMVVGTERPITDMLPADPPLLALTAADPSLAVITASGFQPGEPIIVALCVDVPADQLHRSCAEGDATTEAAAALITGQMEGITRHADDTGTITIEVTLTETISPVLADEMSASCDTTPTRCSVVIAAGADTKRSAVVPYVVTR